MSIAAASDFERAPSDPRIRRLAITAACAALADWLLVGLPINVGSWPILLQKSFWDDDRNFLGPLMRFV
jgi:hypothetical protein